MKLFKLAILSYCLLVVASCSTTNDFSKKHHKNRNWKKYDVTNKEEVLVKNEEVKTEEAFEVAEEVKPETVVENNIEEIVESDKEEAIVTSEKISTKKAVKKSVKKLKALKNNFSNVTVDNKKAKSPAKRSKSDKKSTNGDDMFIIALILAILIPFLGVLVFEGVTQRFWISLILTLLFWLPGAIYAVLVVTGTI